MSVLLKVVIWLNKKNNTGEDIISKTIYSFAELGGNDYEIYTHPRIQGQSIKSPDETKILCEKLFN